MSKKQENSQMKKRKLHRETVYFSLSFMLSDLERKPLGTSFCSIQVHTINLLSFRNTDDHSFNAVNNNSFLSIVGLVSSRSLYFIPLYLKQNKD
jgi:hypothetical protein